MPIKSTYLNLFDMGGGQVTTRFTVILHCSAVPTYLWSYKYSRNLSFPQYPPDFLDLN